MRIKRSTLDIKKEVLQNLSNGKEKTFFHLAKLCNTGTITIMNNCKELSLYDYIKIEKRGTKRIFNFVRITSKGKKLLEKIK